MGAPSCRETVFFAKTSLFFWLSREPKLWQKTHVSWCDDYKWEVSSSALCKYNRPEFFFQGMAAPIQTEQLETCMIDDSLVYRNLSADVFLHFISPFSHRPRKAGQLTNFCCIFFHAQYLRAWADEPINDCSCSIPNCSRVVTVNMPSTYSDSVFIRLFCADWWASLIAFIIAAPWMSCKAVKALFTIPSDPPSIAGIFGKYHLYHTGSIFYLVGEPFGI